MIHVDGIFKAPISSNVLQKYGLQKYGKIQKYIDSSCIRLCSPLTPRDTGALYNSAMINTKIGSGNVIWRTPYARRWYYRPAKFNGAPERGNYWFERMKNNGGRNRILMDVKKMVRSMDRM